MNVLKLKCLAGLAVCAALGACADKPPGCTDAKVLDRIKAGIPSDALKLISNNIAAAGNSGSEQLNGLLDKFGSSMKVEFKNIASDGFDAEAKRYSCAAELEISTVDGPADARRIAYSVQATADGKDFLLSIANYQMILMSMSSSFTDYEIKAPK
jgi:hypothetical protein